MAGYYAGNKFKIVCGEHKIKKGMYMGKVIYSGANPVTYYVDTNTSYVEEVDEGNSVLSPTTFTPSKSGYDFIGWRNDTVVNPHVLSDTTMGDSAITLYAVFSKKVTLSYNGNGATSIKAGAELSKTALQYYNNGNIVNPQFTLNSGESIYVKDSYSFTKWAMGSVNGTQYNSGDTLELSEDTTFYALWELDNLVLFDNGKLRDGDSFQEISWYNYKSGDGKHDGSISTVLYGMAASSNYDRFSYGGGILNKTFDIANYTRLYVEVSDASIPTEYAAHSVGLISTLTIENGEILFSSNPWDSFASCIRSTKSGAHTIVMNLSEYKRNYGNIAYFMYTAQKDIAGGGVSSYTPSTIKISKVWLE